jgi:hypothetical protein
MKNLMNFEIVLEDGHLKETCNIEKLVYVNCAIDLDEVAFYRESLSNEIEVEPFTLVTLKSGTSACLNIEFNKFDQLIKKLKNV